MKQIICSVQEMEDFAKEYVNVLTSSPYTHLIVGLSGDLGTGKTTFSQAVGKILGVKESMVSPTFILAKKYKTKNQKWKNLIHIDAYRFENPEEAVVLNLPSLKEENTLTLLEWPSLTKGVITPDVTITFTHIGDNEREVEYEKPE